MFQMGFKIGKLWHARISSKINIFDAVYFAHSDFLSRLQFSKKGGGVVNFGEHVPFTRIK